MKKKVYKYYDYDQIDHKHLLELEYLFDQNHLLWLEHHYDPQHLLKHDLSMMT